MKLRSTFRFGGNKNIVVYAQNSGEWNGSEFSSSLFSCNGDLNEIESIFNHAINYIYRTYRNYPIRWKDIVVGKIFQHENTEGRVLGDQIRDRCSIIDDTHFKGGYIGNGKSGTSVVHIPELTENHLPVLDKGKKDFLTVTCNFDGFHNCDIEIRKGDLDGVRNYQSIITRIAVNHEVQRWKNTVHRFAPVINKELGQIAKRVNL